MPLHGFTAVDLGYQQGNAVSNIVNGWMSRWPPGTFIDLFDQIWRDPAKVADVTDLICDHIASVYQENSPQRIYFLMLYSIFSEFLEDISEDVLPNERTGYQDSVIWQKLYHFQRTRPPASSTSWKPTTGASSPTASVSARRSLRWPSSSTTSCATGPCWSCAPRSSLTTGSTTTGTSRTIRFAKDRFSSTFYATRTCCAERGESLGMPLNRVNWSNYDLVVIDESHNFRNNDAFKDRETRYQWLMNRVIKQGVKTKVLMLSATPVNNRFNDLQEPACPGLRRGTGKPQRKAEDRTRNIDANIPPGASRVQYMVKVASRRSARRRRFCIALDFDFFELLDSVTIARSRRHITTFYDTKEIGEFPTRRKPLSFHCATDPSPGRDRLQRDFRSADDPEAGSLHAGELHLAQSAVANTKPSTTPKSAVAAAS